MTLDVGARLGPYEITAPLGAGGMGEVYRARDAKLGREVAIKVLPDLLAQDPERLARFRREAQVLASLNHPNIAHIHGLEERDGTIALVMELVEGPTLAERIAVGPVPQADALPIAKQIAVALEAAHEQGIIHRDLKPANIKVRDDGLVKVLDFGLAKLAPTDGSGQNPAAVSHSPTITTPAMTLAGVILGTAAYMSPEQARGKAVDKRCDIWAFGCVLYEMLTGKRAFAGDEMSDTLAFIITKEPDWAALPAGTSPTVKRLLRRCLEKDPKDRLRDIGDARIDISEAQRGPKEEGGALANAPRRKERVAWMSAVALLAVATVAAMAWAFRPAPPALAPEEVRLEITTPPTDDPTSFAISPDGRQIVFVSTSEGKAQLWLRPLDGVLAQQVAGTDGATYPFWSPDSLSVGFFADGQLKRIDLDGGTVQTLASTSNGQGGAWSSDGTILYSTGFASSIRRVSATGGEVTAITRTAPPQQTMHGFPWFLPDGRHALYGVGGLPESAGVYIADLDGLTPRRLLDADTAAVYTPSGQLLFVRQGTLFTQDFDLARLELTGTPYPVARDVAVEGGHAAVSVSATGTMVYRTGVSGERRQFVWVDRAGKTLESVGEVDAGRPVNPSPSPDGRQVAVHRDMNGNTDVWLLDLGRGLFRRLTFDAGQDLQPTWSPDGRRIAFNSNRTGQMALYLKPSNGAGTEELLLTTPGGPISATDWSSDGRVLLYRVNSPRTGYDLWALPLEGDHKPVPIVQTGFNEREGQFSPDGKWIAYQSDESGRFEIYVQPFDGSGGKSQVSTDGGAQVRWRRDGQELFYIGLDNRLMAVPIRLDSKVMVVEASGPVPLFPTRVGGAYQGGDKQQYVVSADGQRFLMNTVVEQAATPLTVILNWKPKP